MIQFCLSVVVFNFLEKSLLYLPNVSYCQYPLKKKFWDIFITDSLVIDNWFLVKILMISLLAGCEDGVSHLRVHPKVSFAAALPPLNLKLACRQTVRLFFASLSFLLFSEERL